MADDSDFSNEEDADGVGPEIIKKYLRPEAGHFRTVSDILRTNLSVKEGSLISKKKESNKKKELSKSEKKESQKKKESQEKKESPKSEQKESEKKENKEKKESPKSEKKESVKPQEKKSQKKESQKKEESPKSEMKEDKDDISRFYADSLFGNLELDKIKNYLLETEAEEQAKAEKEAL